MITLKINEKRFLSDFAGLSKIGATPEGGVDRPSYSPAHLQALAWFKQYAAGMGLQAMVDPAGNHSIRLECAGPSAPVLLMGSHLDSVYDGGRFDGALGVMTALEVLHTLQDAGARLPFNVEAACFTDEEGTLVGMLGSKAVIGEYHPDLLDQGTVSREVILQAFQKGGLDVDAIGRAKRDPRSLYGYLELHIEQGERLYREQTDIGVVTGIVGMCAFRIVYTGKANHAGTTDMLHRQDAGLGASAYNLAARKMVLENYPGCVVTVGKTHFKPGGVNIIPAQAEFSVDYRSIDRTQLDALEADLIRLAHSLAEEYRLGVQIERTLRHEPALMDARFKTAILDSAQMLGLSAVEMPSGAGHDAQNMAVVCPCGMVFVPSVEGISHSPFERTTDQDCVNGANVMLQTVLKLAEG